MRSNVLTLLTSIKGPEEILLGDLPGVQVRDQVMLQLEHVGGGLLTEPADVGGLQGVCLTWFFGFWFDFFGDLDATAGVSIDFLPYLLERNFDGIDVLLNMFGLKMFFHPSFEARFVTTRNYWTLKHSFGRSIFELCINTIWLHACIREG